MKIGIVGPGGVGGYIGGVLARDNDDVYFLARGERKETIEMHGIVVRSRIQGDFTSFPELVSDSPEELGIMDLIIITVKSYSLEEILRAISPMIDGYTVILPLINGTGVGDRIRSELDTGIILDGLIYIISESTPDYSIVQSSSYSRVVFGCTDSDCPPDRLEEIQTLFQASRIEARIASDITAEIWKKYILNCAFNMTTAYHNMAVGEMRRRSDIMEDIYSILEEACGVARAQGIAEPEDIARLHYDHIRLRLNDDATSSLKRDMEAGNRTELEIFGGDLIRRADSLGVAVPVSRRYYEALKVRDWGGLIE